MIERWKEVKGYEGLYEISNKGRIWSNISGRHLRITRGTRRYGQVVLYRSGESKSYLAHRLVAGHFLRKPSDKEMVNHKDGNRFNNDVRNLEWVTPSENVQHAFDTGLKDPMIGERNGRSKLTEAQVRGILAGTIDEGVPDKFYAKKFGVSHQTIAFIRTGLSWVHLEVERMKKTKKGEKNGNAKLTENQAQEALTGMLNHNISMQYFANKFGVSRAAMEAIKYRRTWKHLEVNPTTVKVAHMKYRRFL